GAVRLTVAHWRSVGATGRVHQDRAAAFDDQTLVQPGRRVALQPSPLRLAEFGFVEKLADGGDAFGARAPGPIAGDARMSVFEAKLRGQRECDVEAVLRQEA